MKLNAKHAISNHEIIAHKNDVQDGVYNTVYKIDGIQVGVQNRI